jgi:enolase
MKKFQIKKIKAREILNSRGNPTVEVELETDLGRFFASVPSGASKGKYEAVELRDGGKRYFGKGVKKAVKNIEEIISKKLKGFDVTKQREIDQSLIELDGTENKSKLGTNAIYGVSLAVCKGGAQAKKLPLYKYIRELYNSQLTTYNLPRPSFNIINGGVHAGNDLDFQEFMVCPKSKSFSENLRIGAEIYHRLKEIISKKYEKLATNLGDEGGFAPPINDPEIAIKLILEAAKILNYRNKTSIILDVAASQFFDGKKYKTKIGNFSGEELANFYLKLIKKYPIEGIEDPFAQDDFESWQNLKSKIKSQKSKILIIGDDLTVTNPKRIKMAKEKDLCNAIIVKINQIGTVTEVIEATKLAKSFGWKIMVSHRSGETTDDFISDFAVGIGADFIKSGAPARGERVAKYNRLLKIEEEIRAGTQHFGAARFLQRKAC